MSLETDRKFQETDRQFKQVGKQLGDPGNRLGEFVEGLVKPAVGRTDGFAPTRSLLARSKSAAWFWIPAIFLIPGGGISTTGMGSLWSLAWTQCFARIFPFYMPMGDRNGSGEHQQSEE